MQVEGRVVVVTGGGSGIGKALCHRFASDGAKAVAVVDRDVENAEAVAASLPAAVAMGCDVGSEVEVDAMIARVTDELGPVEVLCNNAGIGTGGDILHTPIEEWQRQWDVNVMAHVYAVRAVLPGMLERREGFIQHTASMAGILTSHGNVPYATTKHAVVGLAEWMAITYHDRGIRTFLLAPLGVDTPMFRATNPEFARLAAGPVRTPEEVAGQVTEAFAEERFLILTDPIAAEWTSRKTTDVERWLRGMRKIQAQM